MVIMLVCGVLVLGGLGAAVAWGGRDFVPPDLGLVELSPREIGRRFVWYAALMLTGGVIAGIAVIGGGGRLAMRLLAATAGDEAQGRITEAEEVVGTISVDGTIGFVVFNGVFGGIIAAALYLVVRRFLPSGWKGGLAFGLASLVVVGTTIDPLRADNVDFDIVGPGWLAVVVFSAVVVAFGVVLAAMMARLSQWLPLIEAKGAVLLRYAIPAAVAVIAAAATVSLAAVCLVVILVTRWTPILRAVRSPRWVIGGRVALAAVVLVALPNAVTTLADIATR